MSTARSGRARIVAAVIVVVVGAAVVLLLPRRGQSPPAVPAAPPSRAAAPQVASAGRSEVELFATSCAPCHGPGGGGDGPNAALLDPHPRDFTGQALRFAATGGTREQMLAAVRRTIARGLPHSAMPGFEAVMTPGEIAALAELVLARGGDHNKQSPPGSQLSVPDPPAFTPGLIERGREVYLANICASCHGTQGQANGAGAPGLTDMDGNPIRPADLSSPLHKSGATPQDLYRTILMGVPGTPMAAYKPMVARSGPGGSVDDRDAWALVALIESFSTPTPPLPAAAVSAAAATGDLSDPSAAGWFDVRPVRVMLHSTVYTPGVAPTVDLRAVRDADGLLIRVSGENLPLERVAVLTAPRDRAGAPRLNVEEPMPADVRSFSAAPGNDAVVCRIDAAGSPVFQVILGAADPADTRFTAWVAITEP